jgi:Protein of unknown function (DUF1574)
MVRPKHDRGRKILIIAAALILTGEIGAGFLIDHAPLKIRFPQAAKVLSSARQLQSGKTILFFGSSRSGNLISAQTVTQVLHESKAKNDFTVFNAALGAGDPVAMEFLTDRLLAAGIRPAMTIIEVLPEVLARRNLWLSHHLARQFTWLEAWHSLPDAHLAGTLSSLLATRLNPVYTFRHEFQQWALTTLNLPFESVTRPALRKLTRTNRVEPADVESLQKGATLARKNVRGYEIGGLNAHALVRMIQRYSTLGATVVLMAPPVSSPYRSAYPASANATYLAYMRRLADIYGVYFVDYRERLPDSYFYTPYYTTTTGKLYFSDLLGREILAPLLNGEETPALKTISAEFLEVQGR